MSAVNTARAPINMQNITRRQHGIRQGHGIISQIATMGLMDRSPGDHPRWHSSFLQPARLSCASDRGSTMHASLLVTGSRACSRLANDLAMRSGMLAIVPAAAAARARPEGSYNTARACAIVRSFVLNTARAHHNRVPPPTGRTHPQRAQSFVRSFVVNTARAHYHRVPPRQEGLTL